MQYTDNYLATLSAAELGREVSAKHISPLEVVRYFEDRITERDPSLNAFTYTRFEYAEQEARRLAERLAAGEETGPFAGVPFALKDFLPSKKGWTNSHGGVASLVRTDPVDSRFCAAMERAGGIPIGKTNAPAFAFRGTCDNLMYGPTHNPFDLTRNSGGSSGGSAAAVADGMIPIAEGSDGGGSIRIPAAWCACFGYKASVGTIPDVKRPDAWSATHPYCFDGGLTRTVEDSAILLNYMAGYDPRDPVSAPQPNIDYTQAMLRSVRGCRVAYTTDYGIFPVKREVADVVRSAADKLRLAGVTVEEATFDIPYTAFELSETWCRSISIDTAIELRLMSEGKIHPAVDPAHLPKEFLYWNDIAAKSTIMDYYRFNTIRTELLDAQERIFDRYDYIISPTTACLPVLNSDDRNTLGPTEINGVPVEPLIGYCETFLQNFTGNPAASVPAGLSSDGLPVGMQIIAKKHHDSDLLAICHTYEQIAPWRDLYTIPFNRKIER